MSISDGIPMSVKNHEFVQNVTHPTVDACEVCMHERKYHATFKVDTDAGGINSGVPLTEAQVAELKERFNSAPTRPVILATEPPKPVEITFATALKIEPGAWYALEVPMDTPMESLLDIKSSFEGMTGAKCIIMAGVTISRDLPSLGGTEDGEVPPVVVPDG